MTEHVLRHDLEELIARTTRSLRAATRKELQVEAHVLSCDVCTTRKRSIETARAAMLAQLPPQDFARATLARAAEERPTHTGGARAKVLRWSVAGGVVAVAAACLLWMHEAVPSAREEVIRFKGTAALEVFVKRGQNVTTMRDGEALASGDQLGFVYTLAKPHHLLLLSIDDTGAISRYYPTEAGAAPLPPGSRMQLPLAVELDGHRGAERLVAFFAEAPPDEGAARRALAAELQRAGSVSKLGAIDVPAQQVSTWFRKP